MSETKVKKTILSELSRIADAIERATDILDDLVSLLTAGTELLKTETLEEKEK